MSPTPLIGTRDGLYVLGDSQPTALPGRSLTHMLVNGADLWALADGTSLLLNPTSPGGTLVAELTAEHANCLAQVEDHILVGSSDAGLHELVDGELRRIKYFDDAPGRSTWYTPWGGPPDVRSMAAASNGPLYLNVHVGGVLRSGDAGRSWQATMDIDADVHQVTVDPHQVGRAYVAAAIGLGVTDDAGDTWTFVTNGLHATYCRAVAVSNGHIYVSASRGSQGRDAALYRAHRDSPDLLSRCRGGLPEWFTTNIDTFCLAAQGDLVVAADASGDVYVSADDGESWELGGTGLPSITCVALL